MAPERIDGTGGEIAQFHGTAEGMERPAVAGEHERNRLRRNVQRGGDLPEGVAEAAQHGDFANALRHAIKCRGIGVAARAVFD